jgi:glutamate N-acetyltransferase/amino-acid N-acetyltransferase|tara:strand:- start:4597 stop:5811 length:1215 start_codon:yes stop_codon:yes gene_type:complete
MAVGNGVMARLSPIAGVRLATAQAGIKYPNRDDIVLIEVSPDATVACVFTQNQFCAAPVTIAKQHSSSTASRYLLINTGNANAGTGRQGLQDALLCCEAVAALLNVASETVLPFSTGVIGEQLPIDKLTSALPNLIDSLSTNGWLRAANGILTTDTRPKAVSKTILINGSAVTVTGMAKGAGMIKPNMATMLGYIATDAKLDKALLQTVLTQCTEQSFNRITIDGDTSTNDACVLIASGESGVVINEGIGCYQQFLDCVNEVFIELAQGLVRDGEGASKFVTVQVDGGAISDECLKVAYTVAESPLVKTALFASDPNWGRLLAAIGRAGVTDLDVDGVTVYIGDVLIAENGCRAASYTEEAGQRVMDKEDITLLIDLGRGNSSEIVWTSDLSYDYVKINAEYRS